MRDERAKSIKDERQTQRKTGKAIIKGNSRERVIADVTPTFGLSPRAK